MKLKKIELLDHVLWHYEIIIILFLFWKNKDMNELKKSPWILIWRNFLSESALRFSQKPYLSTQNDSWIWKYTTFLKFWSSFSGEKFSGGFPSFLNFWFVVILVSARVIACERSVRLPARQKHNIGFTDKFRFYAMQKAQRDCLWKSIFR